MPTGQHFSPVAHCFEFSTLFAIISFFADQQDGAVFLQAACFFFVTLKPSKEKVANTLQVSEADIS